MWLWPIFRWFQANPWAQWVAGIVAAYVAFRVWLSGKIRGERREARKEGREDVIDEINKENSRVEKAIDAADRDAVERLNSEQLRKLTESDPLNRGRAPRD